jgi:hypothetical protein
MQCSTEMHTLASLRRRGIGLVLECDAVSAVYHFS